MHGGSGTSGRSASNSYTIEGLEMNTTYNITVTVNTAFQNTGSQSIITFTVPQFKETHDTTAVIVGSTVTVAVTGLLVMGNVVFLFLVMRRCEGNGSLKALKRNNPAGDRSTIHAPSNETNHAVAQTDTTQHYENLSASPQTTSAYTVDQTGGATFSTPPPVNSSQPDGM